MNHNSQAPSPPQRQAAPYAQPADAVARQFATSNTGLSAAQAAERLARMGSNSLPRHKAPGVGMVFLRQFRSPLIYVLAIAALVSLFIEEWSDAVFICAVLLVNAIIGTIQEYSAQRAAQTLQQLVTARARVVRDSDSYEIDAEQLVPGDIVLLESGDRIPADIRLWTNHDLQVDESLLTGESQAVAKDGAQNVPEESVIAERINMVFAGTLVARGRGRGIVVGTALNTELGRIAEAVLGRPGAKAPLLVRMERFTHRVAIAVALAAVAMALVATTRGMPVNEIFLLAVALAVSAIPEGLPVALTVALSIGMRRMAKRNVIVRKLMAVEALGSCTYIATDKTGTLTINQLTARLIALPGQDAIQVNSENETPEVAVLQRDFQREYQRDTDLPGPDDRHQIQQLCYAAVLANEGLLAHRNHGWAYHGDAIDVALLRMAHALGYLKAELTGKYPERGFIPFESEHLFAASVNHVDGQDTVFIKGAVEKLLPMCRWQQTAQQPSPINQPAIERQAEQLAAQGYRVIALASGPLQQDPMSTDSGFTQSQLRELIFLGLVGLIDPLRSTAKAAVQNCQQAGIKVGMVTGDHPTTALSIARQLGLAQSSKQLVTGAQIRQAMQRGESETLIRDASVFARVEPQQKLDIVTTLQKIGHFVAVSGDGANDAPALRAANVGVAMGKSGTDLARETAELIITDDNFASIVAGVEEGRIAYANVRKVIFLLISTGAAELVLFTLALMFGLPLPLLAVQLLWLNLVTNGIQDVALAFEPGEGDELRKAPRKPKEPVFNRLMVERVLLSSLVMGSVTFVVFQWFINNGFTVEQARNGALLLMVLFENIHVFNSRSETLSAFTHNPMRNPLLLIGTITAQLVHIGAMYTPWLNEVLGIEPLFLDYWLYLLGCALTVLVTMEIHKMIYRRRVARDRTGKTGMSP